MNDGLLDAIRHNTWATRTLLTACEPLTQEQLDTSVIGGFGTIAETLWHFIRSEASYQRRLTGDEVAWDFSREAPFPGVATLHECNDDLGERWESFLAAPFDAERIHVVQWIGPVDARDVPAGVIIAQAIHHGSEHRSQVATILTVLGIEPPEWGAWEYAEETGRAPEHVPQ